jgi:hypothetical protein
MIQGCKPAQHTLFSLGFSVVVNWRGTVIIKSAGEPVFGAVSSTINGTVAGPTTGTGGTIHVYIT